MRPLIKSLEAAAMEGHATNCSDYGLVITCEHGGNRIPEPYREQFRTHRALLNTHRGFDPGALIMAKALATSFSAAGGLYRKPFAR